MSRRLARLTLRTPPTLIPLTIALSGALTFSGCFEAEDPVDAGTTAGSGGAGGVAPMGGEPVGGDPVGGEPMGGEPVGGEPVGGEPVGGEPVGGEPVGGGPMGGEPMGGGGCTPAEELCNGQDDDCDGNTDEDFDLGAACDPGAGYCPGSAGTYICDGNGGRRCDGGDSPRVRPERCNGDDDDCDGAIDEGTERACYNGRPGSEGQGLCRAGSMLCVDGVQQQECTGEIVPNPTELCGDGEDDDCDGQVDEDCDCEAGEVRPCGSDIGICQQGEQTCESGLWGDCVGAIDPQLESCNGLDDDCDGATDEGTDVTCYNGPPGTADVGVCESGLQRCIGGQISNVCDGEIGPEVPQGQDLCGGGDQDCDGNTDEDHQVVNTTCGFGACVAAGQLQCRNGIVVDTCTPGQPANNDLCDGVDNDCDGITDEDHVETPLTCGVGACEAQGAVRCTAGQVVNDCTPGVPAPVETCDVGEEIDDDCDGEVDESCPWQTEDLDDLLSRGCGGCHGAGNPRGGFNISGGVQSVVGVFSNGGPTPYITAGSPQNSYMFRKMEGTQLAAGGGGGRMPPGGAWTAYQLERLRLWIQDVAQ